LKYWKSTKKRILFCSCNKVNFIHYSSFLFCFHRSALLLCTTPHHETLVHGFDYINPNEMYRICWWCGKSFFFINEVYTITFKFEFISICCLWNCGCWGIKYKTGRGRWRLREKIKCVSGARVSFLVYSRKLENN
jgi:hypothetical protein